MTTRDSDGRGAAPAEPTRRVRGRPRSDEIEGTILKVAGELLAEGGFAALNFDALAARARCSKATIYRRWTSKGHLAVATLAELPDPALPDRGDLREDLRGLCVAIGRRQCAAQVISQMILQHGRARLAPSGL